ncbi:MAG: peptidyl-alpha-hydroxyglycine alpha-amidating lyase family protein [Woeseiaceae bacterium]|jgi:peptidylamidoglycolate lyase|nr:peptidyl-alpha-hydroxyglycine alpha-amidating lyase family protein [Woeseiaceae bacterium]
MQTIALQGTTSGRAAARTHSPTFAALPVLLLTSLGAANAIAADDDAYSVVHGWPILPEGRSLGRASGVAVDSHNHVFVFHSADRNWVEPFPDEPIEAPTVVVFDGDTGAVVAEWGARTFVMPHGLTIDGEDNVWLTDVGRHQVFKYSHDGEPLLELGEDRTPGTDAAHFNLPTDVAVLDDGGFFVSDGYGNSRVLKFSPDGEFEFQWGTKGSKPGQFDLPHGLATDDGGRVYVADRSNSRVQVFDREGSFLAEWPRDDVGRPYGLDVDADTNVFVVDGGDQPKSPPDRSRAMRLSRAGSVEVVFGRFGNYDGQFQMGHDIAVGDDGAVYVVDITGKRVQKFTAD